jgi:hypothetical protein
MTAKPLTFGTVKTAHEYLVDKGWTVKGGKPPTLATIQKAINQSKLTRHKDGTFHAVTLDKYAALHMTNDTVITATTAVREEIEREKLRKLKLENDTKSGQLVSLSEEIKRRVSVIQGFKSSLINSKATFSRSLRDGMKQRHPESEVLNDLLLDASELYESAVLDCFDEISKRGRV